MSGDNMRYAKNPLSEEVVTRAAATKSIARECMQKRSRNPFDYMEYFSSMLKLFGESNVREFADDGRSKNNDESKKLREQGNKIFVSRNDLESLGESLELYTKSIAYAVPNTKELAMSFANRSAVLIKLNRPKESLEDLERALKSNYPEELVYKLHYRKAQCFSILSKHSYIQSKFWLNKVPVYDQTKEKLNKQLASYSEMDYESTVDKEILVIPEIKSPNAKFPCASDAIDVEYCSGYPGRKIVATRDIGVGEVLVVERPYLVYSNDYSHCAHCLEGFWAGIPCQGCVHAVYCSEKCQLSAWEEYHSTECLVLNFMEQKGALVDSSEYYPEFLIKMTKEAGGLKGLKKRVKDFQENNGKRGELQGEWYAKQTLERILTLTDNFEKISNDDFAQGSTIAVLTLLYMTRANFFDMKEDLKGMSKREILLLMSQNSDVLFAGGLLLQIYWVQRIHMSCPLERAIREDRINKQCLELVPFTDLFSFSCYNNAVRQFVGEYVVVHTIAPIAKGEEVYLYIGNLWPFDSKEERHLEFTRTYHECTWTRCEENWPMLYELESYKARVKSREMGVMLKKVMKPFRSLQQKISDEDMSDKESILAGLKKMIEAIYKGVNLPCREQALLLDSIAISITCTREILQRSNPSNIISNKGRKIQQLLDFLFQCILNSCIIRL